MRDTDPREPSSLGVPSDVPLGISSDVPPGVSSDAAPGAATFPRRFAKRYAQRLARRLALLAAAHASLRGLAVFGLLAGFLLVLIEAGFGPLDRLPLWWCLAAALGAVAGALASRRKRIGIEDAASWFDGALGTRELLSAAIRRSATEKPGRFDTELEERFRSFAETRPRVPYPLARLARGGAVATIALLVFGGAFLMPAERAEAASTKVASLDEGSARALAERAAAGLALAPEETRALGAWLFPKDERLAAELQRDLDEARFDDLRSLLDSASRRIEEALARRPSEADRRRLVEDRDRLSSAAGALGPYEGTEDSGGMDEEGGSSDRGSYDSRGGAPSRPRTSEPGEGPSSGEGSRGLQPRDGTDSNGSSPSPPGSGAPDSGGPRPPGLGGADSGNAGKGEELPGEDIEGRPRAGQGFGSPREWGELGAEAGGGELVIPNAPDASFFQYVLESGGGPATARGSVETAARSQEEALSRRTIPSDYEQLVRDYFLALAREAETAAGSREETQGGSP